MHGLLPDNASCVEAFRRDYSGPLDLRLVVDYPLTRIDSRIRDNGLDVVRRLDKDKFLDRLIIAALASEGRMCKSLKRNSRVLGNE